MLERAKGAGEAHRERTQGGPGAAARVAAFLHSWLCPERKALCCLPEQLSSFAYSPPRITSVQKEASSPLVLPTMLVVLGMF